MTSGGRYGIERLLDSDKPDADGPDGMNGTGTGGRSGNPDTVTDTDGPDGMNGTGTGTGGRTEGSPDTDGTDGLIGPMNGTGGRKGDRGGRGGPISMRYRLNVSLVIVARAKMW